MESESKRNRKKNLVLIMHLKIGEVAHTDTLLLGTWLWFIYFVCGTEQSTGNYIKGKPYAWPSGFLYAAKATVTLKHWNPTSFMSLLLLLLFWECKLRRDTELVPKWLEYVPNLRITAIPHELGGVKPLDNRYLWEHATIQTVDSIQHDLCVIHG